MPSTAARSTASFHDPEPTAEILAAGVLPWRVNGRGLEVLLIHRPDYDDWSWPKGKLDDGETLPECAVREVREEIGLDVELGLPLPSTHYTVNGGTPKEVWYWAVEVARQSPQVDGKEVDRVEWVSAEQALEQLTNASDVEPLTVLIAAHRERTLRTVPFIVLRHAKAKPRSSWSRAEGARPLAPTGQRQALAVRRLLGVWAPRKIITSPWRRCVETVTPYVKDTGRGLKENGAFTEKAVKSKPKRTGKEVDSLLAKVRASVLCTHRPVLPVVLDALTGRAAREGRDAVLAALPRKDPYLKPGGMIVAQRAVDAGGRIVSLEVYDVWDD
ncbi:MULTISPECIES: NUDIX hydrolase [Micrococcaceae]|uniref:NUDIX hydrolase n=1 Tax=Micrococcaceae TaxID=1268 RepID=UPI0016112CBE|nr:MULTISPECIES: NUDIX hydrolase [Micrococcaceae]MBB5749696.1 8-oxo-dGTP diphosphatase [Micrococcus sp. TA1]HRO29972.1 NUDIX hydrolase [Citricoccus sp.]HRO93260.1 NUDIX hydrolase [Citricoccus sp.]